MSITNKKFSSLIKLRYNRYMKQNGKAVITYLLDFDSTFIKSEGLDVLAEISLKTHPRKKEIVRQIRELTQRGMEGEIPYLLKTV
jgi:hypothetical protein